MPGTLYLVATPIGNLQDMTFRGIETLRSVDLIACEDTRHTRNLLNHFRISNKTVSYHEHNEHERTEEFADRLLRGESIAIVSDAGTPGICDPAFRIVQRTVQIGIDVVPVPGAVAFVNAAVASGLATDSLFFAGFLPAKKGERRKRLQQLSEIPATLVFYEAPHRLAKSLIDCYELLGDRRAAVARELTKLHEEFVRGSLAQLAHVYSKAAVKGEIVLVIEKGKSEEIKGLDNVETTLAVRVEQLEKEGLDPKSALKKAAKEFGLSKSAAYKMIVAGKNTDLTEGH